MAKNLSIVAQGISGDARHLLGYNVTDNGIYTPAIGDVARDTTATYVAQDGTIKTAAENVARVDYTNGVAELLLEPESTNLFQYSEDFSQSYWIKQSSIVQGGYASPNGDNSAFKYIPNNGQGGNRSIGKSIVGLSGKYTFSVYVKESGFRYVHLRLRNAPNRQMIFDFQTETFEVYNVGFFAEGNMQKVGDFYRLSFTTDADESDAIGELFYSISLSQDADLGPNFNGNGVDGVTIANAQLEALDYSTSYIPTNGAIATRGADSLTNFGSEQIIDSESGILFFEGSALSDGGANRRFSISDGTSANRLYVDYRTDGAFRVQQTSNGLSGTINYSLTQIDLVKLCLRYNSQGIELFLNGVRVGQDATLVSFSPLTRLSLTDATNNFPFYGRVRQVKHLPYNTDITTL